MRICVFGAGAVGSHFAVRLALAGHDVSCVMRGAHLDAVRVNGLTLRVGDTEFKASVNASSDPAMLGPQDAVITTLKATGLPSLATGMQPLLGDDTAVVFAQNGIPWWYDIGLSPGHPKVPDLAFLDPGGRLRAAIPKSRIVGGVVFSSNEVIAPGVVANLSPERNRLLIGECDDRPSERVTRLRAALNEAGIESPDVSQIRETVWSKLLTNMSMSVLCLLTGQTARGVRDDPDLADVVPRLLDEANSIAQSCFPEVKRVTRSGPARASRVRTRRRAFDADARPDGGTGDPSGARQGALSGLTRVTASRRYQARTTVRGRPDRLHPRLTVGCRARPGR
jgi:2-dehydropantoate 2-reductase